MGLLCNSADVFQSERTSSGAPPDQHTEVRDQLLRNGIDPGRATIVALNELRYWTPEQVQRVFDTLPRNREKFPFGPTFSIPNPTGWKMFILLFISRCGSLISLSVVLAAIPILVLGVVLGLYTFEKFIERVYEVLSVGDSSFYIKPSISQVRKAVQKWQAHRWGRFEARTSGYMAISHIWAETMGIFKVFTRTSCEWMWLDLITIPPGLSP